MAQNAITQYQENVGGEKSGEEITRPGQHRGEHYDFWEFRNKKVGKRWQKKTFPKIRNEKSN